MGGRPCVAWMNGSLAALTLLTAQIVHAAPLPEKATEYGTKAKLLLVVLPYVEWVSEATWKAGPFRVAVLGESLFGSELDESARTLTVHHRPIRIQYVSRLREAEGCQALFICASEIRRMDAILAWAEGREILTVADNEQLARRGVMLNLLHEGEYVRLVINPEAAQAAGLIMGSQLKALARIISTPRRRP